MNFRNFKLRKGFFRWITRPIDQISESIGKFYRNISSSNSFLLFTLCDNPSLTRGGWVSNSRLYTILPSWQTTVPPICLIRKQFAEFKRLNCVRMTSFHLILHDVIACPICTTLYKGWVQLHHQDVVLSVKF